MNKLFYGDNLTIMQHEMGKDSVDLIYLDPPFNSKKNYNLMYKNLTGLPVPEQVEAFCDTWELDPEKEERAKQMPILMREYGVDDYYVDFWRIWVNALRNTQPHLLAYLIYMVERLLHMRSILRPTGSIYLHCDPTASHYIKVMMDGIFGHQNFQNELIWKRTGSHGGSKRWGPIHDTILFYTKSANYTWNRVFQDYDEDYIEKFYRFTDKRGRYRLVTLTGAGVRTGDSGKEWRGVNPTASGRHWAVPLQALKAAYPTRDLQGLSTQEKLDLLDKAGLVYWPPRGSVPQQKRYADENPGVPIQDIITDIRPISSHADERLGYPTQKPIALLKRIILASTNKNEVVFDPFCGCGTAIYAAHETERKWIGCDIAILPIVKIIKNELEGRYRLVEGKHFEINGIPLSMEGAETLFKRDPFQFQHWLVERIGGFPMQKKVADRGIDGRLYFETRDGLKEMVLSVKGGTIRPTDVRDLRGVLEREENAEIAGFLSLHEPTKAMRSEAAEAGCYEYEGVKYDRIQFLTVKQILEEKRLFHTPTRIGVRVATGQPSLGLLGEHSENKKLKK